MISLVEEPLFHLEDLLEKICRFLHQIKPYILISNIFSPRAVAYIGTLCAFSGNPLGLSWKDDLVPRYVCLDSIGAYISIFISFYHLQI